MTDINENENHLSLLWEARAKPGKEDELRSFVAVAVTASRHDAGCIDYEAHEVEGQPGTFIIYERWVIRKALDAHFREPRMEHLIPQLEALIEGSIEGGIRFLRVIRPAQYVQPGS
jgi:quinol monooxygenase YgiN